MSMVMVPATVAGLVLPAASVTSTVSVLSVGQRGCRGEAPVAVGVGGTVPISTPLS
ncbi:hypothetical protein [Atlantibacter hermannii]|uniref:hypothetical protein n=1 Tax=Atlantibacter hermannii TaxID=565 RepID=UPI0012FF42DD|nr:hypothetical protein [Atlantibacter hermannii]